MDSDFHFLVLKFHVCHYGVKIARFNHETLPVLWEDGYEQKSDDCMFTRIIYSVVNIICTSALK